MGYLDSKDTSVANIYKNAGLFDRYILSKIKTIVTSGMNDVDALKTLDKFITDELEKNVGAIINDRIREMSYISDASVKLLRQKLWNDFLTRTNDNALYSYEKIHDKYGFVIDRIRSSEMRDRLYMESEIAEIRRYYITETNKIFDGTSRVELVATKLNDALTAMEKSKHGYTIVNSQLMNTYRAQEDDVKEMAKLDMGIYYGSIRPNTRDFCLDHLAEVLPWDEWVEMENDLGDVDVTTYAGGHNCSHRVYAVNDQLADEAQSTLNEKYKKDGGYEQYRDDLKEKMIKAKEAVRDAN